MRARTWIMLAGLVAAVLLAPDAASAGPIRIVMLVRTSQVMPDVIARFEREHGTGLVDVVVTTDADDPKVLRGAKVIFVEHGNADSLPPWKAEATAAARQGAKVFSDLPDNLTRFWEVPIDAARNQQAFAYWQYGGEENLAALLSWLYREGGGTAVLEVPPPVPELREGAYHPRAGRIFPTLAEYLQWYRADRPTLASAPLVGVMFFHTNYKSRDLAHIDALIEELEHQGLAAVGVFGWPLSTIDHVLQVDGRMPLRLMLSFNLSLTRPEDGPALQRYGLHVISLMTTREPYAVWKDSPIGVTPDRVSTQISNPEAVGATEPILVATSETVAGSALPKTTPIAERIGMVVARAKRWLALQERPNAEKRLAMLYYNNPPGKGNIGASYLNLPPSIVAVLEELKRSGYTVGESLPDARTLLDLLVSAGRNVELWAPGEINRLVHDGHATLIPMAQYRQWFAALPQAFREFVIGRWGEPEQSTLMTYVAPDGTRSFVLPGLQLGNVFLGPQPLRASFDEYTNVQHSSSIPPPHAYVAAYMWYRHQFHADAVVHLGRHGTLEWLPGKNAGQAGWDSSEVLLGDLPNVNYYIMDGGGEDLQARRRSAAVLISHLTPLLVAGGKQHEFDALNASLDNYNEVRNTSAVLADLHRTAILAEVSRLKLDTQLKLEGLPFDQVAERVHVFLEQVEDAPIPMGLPTLGQLPREDVQREALGRFIESGFEKAEADRLRPALASWVDAIWSGHAPEVSEEFEGPFGERVTQALIEARTWLENLRLSPARELTALTEVLAGRYVSSGPTGDPLRSPASLPSGRNLHGLDPSMLPTKAAWQVGQKLGRQFLDRYQAEHHRAPERISMVLWHGETNRHQGAMESEALWLMGVEPEWNPRGVPDRLRLVPDDQLGRPRVDVVFTVSGLYRDALAEKILLLDRAARLAASAGPNPLSRQNQRTALALKQAGLSDEDADRMAQARVFASAPGTYGFGLEKVVEQSKDIGNERGMADLYLDRMNYVFTADAWGTRVPKLLESQLQGNEAVIHSRSSNLYGLADNDDFYQYVGGLNVVSREVNGAAPDLFLNNLRAGGRERLEDMRTALSTELTSRNWNPKWLKEMQAADYSGARAMMQAVEYLYGWQATSPEIVDGSMWQNTYDVYVADKHGLDMQAFFDKNNPHAYQAVVARLLEVDRQGRYRFSDAERSTLVEAYVKSVNAHGAACSANTCGNLRLHQHVAGLAPLVPGLGNEAWKTFGTQMARSTQWTVRQFPTASAALQTGLAAAQPPRPLSVPAPAARVPAGPPVVEGFRMSERTITLAPPTPTGAPRVVSLAFAGVWLLFLLGMGREALRSWAPAQP